MTDNSSLIADRDMPPWIALMLRWQFETNCLASVAIEMPALRPALERRVRNV